MKENRRLAEGRPPTSSASSDRGPLTAVDEQSTGEVSARMPSLSDASESSLVTEDFASGLTQDEAHVSLPYVTNDSPPPDVMEKRLAQEMALLSVSERDQVLNDVHGVSELPNEEPVFLCRKITELEALLRSLSTNSENPSGDAYRLALATNPEYATNGSFLLMFLRADSFNVQSAASRILLHFSLKRKLFGDDKLAKQDITLNDLSHGDLYTLYSGYVQPQPIFDKSGRSIVLIRLALLRYYKIENIMRAYWYICMRWVRDESVQRRGVVFVADNDGVNEEKDLSFVQVTCAVRQAVPFRIVASHLIVTNPEDKPVMGIIPYFLEQPHRLRFRSHFARNNDEILQTLMSFGISFLPFRLPKASETSIVVSSNIHQFQTYVRQRRAQLLLEAEPEEETSIGTSNAGFKVQQLRASRGKRKTAEAEPSDIEITPVRLSSMDQRELHVENDLESNVGSTDSTDSGNRSGFVANSAVSAAGVHGGGTDSNDLVPTQEDVLVGCGARREHPGTKLLEQLVQGHLQEYINADRSGKAEIVRSVAQKIRDGGGRFLKRAVDNADDWEGNVGVWVEVERKVAHKKISNIFARLRKQSP